MSEDQFQSASNQINQTIGALNRVIIGQPQMSAIAVLSLVMGRNFLLTGEPGLAKTLLVKTLGQITGMSFGRIQINPDIMPTDITGNMIWNPQSGLFELRPGPVLRYQLLLVDELNRGNKMIHAALIEAGEEGTATIDGISHKTPEFSMIAATMNDQDSDDSVRPVSRAMLDRFALSIVVRRPGFDDELTIASNVGSERDFDPVHFDLKELRPLATRVILDTSVLFKKEATRMVRCTIDAAKGDNAILSHDAGVRASRDLISAAAAHALMQGKGTFELDNVKAMAMPVLRHRVETTEYMTASEKDSLIKELIK